MSLRDLIERLEELEADLEGTFGPTMQPEVIAAYQSNYPLSGTVDGACVLEEDGDECESTDARLIDGRPVVWLAIGGHPRQFSPYAPRAVFSEAS